MSSNLGTFVFVFHILFSRSGVSCCKFMLGYLKRLSWFLMLNSSSFIDFVDALNCRIWFMLWFLLSFAASELHLLFMFSFVNSNNDWKLQIKVKFIIFALVSIIFFFHYLLKNVSSLIRKDKIHMMLVWFVPVMLHFFAFLAPLGKKEKHASLCKALASCSYSVFISTVCRVLEIWSYENTWLLLLVSLSGSANIWRFVIFT